MHVGSIVDLKRGATRDVLVLLFVFFFFVPAVLIVNGCVALASAGHSASC